MFVLRPIIRIKGMSRNQVSIRENRLMLFLFVKPLLQELKIKIFNLKQTAKQIFNGISAIEKTIGDNVKKFLFGRDVRFQIFDNRLGSAVQLSVNVAKPVVAQYVVIAPRSREAKPAAPVPDLLTIKNKFKKKFVFFLPFQDPS